MVVIHTFTNSKLAFFMKSVGTSSSQIAMDMYLVGGTSADSEIHDEETVQP